MMASDPKGLPKPLGFEDVWETRGVSPKGQKADKKIYERRAGVSELWRMLHDVSRIVLLGRGRPSFRGERPD